MTFLRFTTIFALSAPAAIAAATVASNLRGRNVLSIVEPPASCPIELPEAGTGCQAGLECEYDHVKMPTHNADGTCSEPFTCNPTVFALCGSDGRWLPPLAVGLKPCAGEIPAESFGSCDPLEPVGCPTEEPDQTTRCQPGITCEYGHILFPTYDDNMMCSDPFSCSPTVFYHCGDDGIWEPPIAAGLAGCEGDEPPEAFQSCDPSVPTVCPTEMPEFGGKCKAGITCDYDHILIPSYQDDGSCTGPYSCSPIASIECQVDGTWGPPLLASMAPCAGEQPFPAFDTCSPTRDSVCPVEAPQPGTKCNRYENLPACEYDFIESPTVQPNGKCSSPYSCVPTKGCECDKEGVWQCWLATPAICEGGRPMEACDPNE